jgi:hypothetical protein
MSFFNDFLFRKDVDTFRYCIRSLINEYREFLVPPKAHDTDERKEKLIRNIKENITVVAGKSTNMDTTSTSNKKTFVGAQSRTDFELHEECISTSNEQAAAHPPTEAEVSAGNMRQSSTSNKPKAKANASKCNKGSITIDLT